MERYPDLEIEKLDDGKAKRNKYTILNLPRFNGHF